MSLRKQAKVGMVWTFAQQFGNQFIGFVISLVLARLLLPEEFGLIGMIAIFYSIGRSLMNSGMTQSLVRGKNLDQEDFSTVFFFNLIASALVYILIFVLAPFIAEFYEQPMLASIVRLYCITFFIDAFAAVQRARLVKEMNFRTETLITIPSTILGGTIGVGMAFLGYGVWSLVWSTIITSLGSTIQFWYYSKWTPSFLFNYKKFKDHFNFGYKISLSGILNRIFNNIYLIVIGKFFAADFVGFYTRAETMNKLPVNNLANALNKVTYPLFSKIQNDDVRLKKVYKQLMQGVLLIITPILVLLAVLAEPTFSFLFTDKWLPAVPFFQILCITGVLYPINMYNLNILKVKGRSDLFLKLEIIKKILISITLIVTVPFGIFAILWGQVFTSLIGFFINSYYTGKFINYNSLDQIKAIAPILIVNMLVGLLIYLIDIKYLRNLDFDILQILLGSLLGGSIYFLAIFLFQRDLLNQFIHLIRKK